MNDFFRVTGYDYEPPEFSDTFYPRPAAPKQVHIAPGTTQSAALPQQDQNTITITNDHLFIIIFALICVIVFLIAKLDRIENSMRAALSPSLSLGGISSALMPPTGF